MRDPPAKNKQKIKESTAKLLFYLLEIFDCFTRLTASYASQFPDYSNTWRSLCEEGFTELVKKTGKTSGFLGTQEHFGC
jgi:hypothetical protein